MDKYVILTLFYTMSRHEFSRTLFKEKGGGVGEGFFKDLDVIKAPRYNVAVMILPGVKLFLKALGIFYCPVRPSSIFSAGDRAH